MRNFLLPIITVLFMLGCTASDKSSTPKKSIYQNYIETNKLESLDKISSFRFHGWRSLDNKTLIISTRINKPYLVQLKNYCSELRFAHTILVNSSGSTLTTKFDSIQVLNSGTPKHHREKCYIKNLYKLTKEQADEISSLNKQSKDKAKKEKESNGREQS